MASKKFTLIEPHFEGDVQVGPKTIATGESTVEAGSDEEAPEDATSVSIDTEEGEESGGSPLAVLGVLVVLVVLAVVVKKVMGGSDEVDLDDVEPLEDLDEE